MTYDSLAHAAQLFVGVYEGLPETCVHWFFLSVFQVRAAKAEDALRCALHDHDVFAKDGVMVDTNLTGEIILQRFVRDSSFHLLD